MDSYGASMQAMLAHTREHMYVKNAHFEYLGASAPYAMQVFGEADPNALIGKTDFDLFSDHEWAETTHAEDEKILLRQSDALECRQVYPGEDGAPCFLCMIKYPILDSDGNVTGILGRGDDISERLASERREEQQGRLLNRQSGIFAAMRDVYHIILFYDLPDDRYYHITGGENANEYVKLSGKLSEVVPSWMAHDLTPEMRESCREFFDLTTMCARLTAYGVLTREVETTNFGWLRISLLPVDRDADGNVYTCLWVSEKIDDQVRIRGELENRIAILEALRNVYHVCMFWDLADNTYFRVSGKAYQENSVVPASGVLNDVVYAWMQHDMTAQVRSDCAEFFELSTLPERLRDHGVLRREINTITSGWLRTSLIPVSYDSAGNVISCLFVGESIDQEKRVALERQETLAAAKQAAEEANASKTRFLSRMSHDMRTPMNAILGLSAMIKEKQNLEEIYSDIDQIQISGHYLLNLINDTLDVNRIEAGKLTLHPKPMDSRKVFDSIYACARQMAQEAGVRLVLEGQRLNSEHWMNIVADASRLEQIFLNLLSNAIKFTPAGKRVRLGCTVEEHNAESIFIRYTVEDEGIGMSEEFLPHLFEPYTQEGRILPERQNGTGLGMSIIKELVALMDGTISVRSRLNVGTRVTLRLRFPISQSAPEDTAEKAINTRALVGKRVLLVEDNAVNRKLAVCILDRWGILTECASNGKEGVERFAQAAPGYYDLILMDIMMPVMDGYKATQCIRALPRPDAATIPVIAMTANAFDRDVSDCIAAGMNAHVAKPIETQKLYQTMVTQLASVPRSK